MRSWDDIKNDDILAKKKELEDLFNNQEEYEQLDDEEKQDVINEYLYFQAVTDIDSKHNQEVYRHIRTSNGLGAYTSSLSLNVNNGRDCLKEIQSNSFKKIAYGNFVDKPEITGAVSMPSINEYDRRTGNGEISIIQAERAESEKQKELDEKTQKENEEIAKKEGLEYRQKEIEAQKKKNQEREKREEELRKRELLEEELNRKFEEESNKEKEQEEKERLRVEKENRERSKERKKEEKKEEKKKEELRRKERIEKEKLEKEEKKEEERLRLNEEKQRKKQELINKQVRAEKEKEKEEKSRKEQKNREFFKAEKLQAAKDVKSLGNQILSDFDISIDTVAKRNTIKDYLIAKVKASDYYKFEDREDNFASKVHKNLQIQNEINEILDNYDSAAAVKEAIDKNTELFTLTAGCIESVRVALKNQEPVPKVSVTNIDNIINDVKASQNKEKAVDLTEKEMPKTSKYTYSKAPLVNQRNVNWFRAVAEEAQTVRGIFHDSEKYMDFKYQLDSTYEFITNLNKAIETGKNSVSLSNFNIIAREQISNMADENGKISIKNLKSAYEESWKLTQEKAIAYEKYKLETKGFTRNRKLEPGKKKLEWNGESKFKLIDNILGRDSQKQIKKSASKVKNNGAPTL
ncbi:MAG: hypothetical protein E7301_11415 [Butyrivibrio sp.]|nr:hypothetical protein [Butyrivibrio sp.]